MNDFEVRLIAQALERHNGDVTAAARELGITRQGLARIVEGRRSSTKKSSTEINYAEDLIGSYRNRILATD